MLGITKNTPRLSNSNHPTDGYLRRNAENLISFPTTIYFYIVQIVNYLFQTLSSISKSFSEVRKTLSHTTKSSNEVRNFFYHTTKSFNVVRKTLSHTNKRFSVVRNPLSYTTKNFRVVRKKYYYIIIHKFISSDRGFCIKE